MNMAASESIWDKLGNLDRRILFWAIVLIIIIPLIHPLGLPVTVSERVREAYNFVEKAVKPRDIALIDLGTGLGPMPETMPGLLAMTRQLMRLQARIVFTTGYISPEAVVVIETVMDQTLRKDPKFVYGEHYVNFGWYTGGGTAIRRLASSWKDVFTRDWYGTPNERLPIMKDITGADSFRLVWHVGPEIAWITYWKLGKNVPVLVTYMALNIPTYLPYYAAGDIYLLGGQRESAEYEILVGVPGPGVPAMDYQSLGHLFVLAVVVLGNLGHIRRKLKRGTQ